MAFSRDIIKPNLSLGRAIWLLPLACLLYGCGGNVGLVGDHCQWERWLYKESRDLIRGDTLAMRAYGKLGDSIQVVVADSARSLNIDYSDIGLEVDRPNLNGMHAENVAPKNLCRNYEIFGLQRLSTAKTSRVGLVFGEIDSTFRPGMYIITCALCYNTESEMSKIYRLPTFGGDLLVYAFCYNSEGKLLSARACYALFTIEWTRKGFRTSSIPNLISEYQAKNSLNYPESLILN